MSDPAHEVKLSSGRVLYGYGGVIGVDARGQIFSGFDDSLDFFEDPLTADERRELADLMIARWRAFAS